MKLKVNFDKFSQNSLLYEKVVHDIIHRWCLDLHILFKTIFNVTCNERRAKVISGFVVFCSERFLTEISEH